MARAQPKPDSDETEPDRPNAATRAIAFSKSNCCDASTELVKLEKAKKRFSLQLRKEVEQTDHSGDEVVAVCRDCRNAVGLVCG